MMTLASELLALAAAVASLQGATLRDAHVQDPLQPAPYAVGERAEYNVKYLFASGRGSMEVAGIDTVRGRSALHFIFTFNGGALGYNLKDSSQSWVDETHFRTLRFHQDQVERGNRRAKRYEIYPERSVYTDGTKPEQPTVADPLDDVSFMYFVRRQKLEVGQTLEYRNYFKPESNPVKLEVLRRERIEVPAGKFMALVVRPTIKTKGIFSESGRALMWISDDSTRVVVQIQTKLYVGTVTMKLVSYRPALPLVPGGK